MRFFSQNFGTIKRILPGSSSTSYPGSFFGEGKTLAGAGHVAPRFWVLNCNSTKGGVGEERCIANIDSRTKMTVVISLKVDFFQS